jgi:hypothetical protein
VVLQQRCHLLLLLLLLLCPMGPGLLTQVHQLLLELPTHAAGKQLEQGLSPQQAVVTHCLAQHPQTCCL